MTREEALKIARSHISSTAKKAAAGASCGDDIASLADFLLHHAASAAESEREACAKIVRSYDPAFGGPSERSAIRVAIGQIEAEILARNEP